MRITSFLFRDGAFLGMQQMSADEYEKKFGFRFSPNELHEIHMMEGRVSFSSTHAAHLWLVRSGMYIDIDEVTWKRLLDDLFEDYKEE